MKKSGSVSTAMWLVALLGLAIARCACAESALLSEFTYKRLSIIQELMGEQKYADALKRLDALAKAVSSRKYEKAVVLQTYGYLYVSTDKPRKAIEVFSQSLGMGVMPESAEQNVRINLAQLYLSVGENRKAVTVYEAWIKREKSPSPAGFALGGTLYAVVKDYGKAEKYLELAIKGAKEPREDWYRMLLAVYYQDTKYSQAASLLRQMIARYPGRKEYWQQLSGVYSTAGNNHEALAAMQLAYRRGFLTEEKELVNLARFYMYLNIPYKAAQLMEGEMKKGRVQASRENLELLYNAYTAANELDKAIEVLHRISGLSPDSGVLVKIARLQAQMGHWKDVNTNVGKAIAMGHLDDAGRVYMLQGISFYQLKNPAKAVEAFRRALRSSDTKHEAQQWLAFLRASRAPAD